MVFCISPAVLTTNSCFVSRLVISFIVSFIPAPRVPIITGIIVILYPSLFSLVSTASCRYRVSVSFHFASIRHAMSQIQVCFSSFVSSIKSDLLAVSVFCRLNWKSQTSFALLFSKTIPCSHCFLYHTVSTPINLCFFGQVTASIISAPLCLAKYSLLDKTVGAFSYQVFHRFIVSLTYSAPSIFNQSSGRFPGSRFHHLFHHWHDR